MRDQVSGHVNSGFESVKQAFTENFSEGMEEGASFCVIKDGEIVVDLIGGTRDKRRSLPWMADTLVPVFSSTKAVAALVIAWLVENDRLSYEDEIQELWPEFAAHGKGRLTIAQILSHQSGLSGLTEEIQPSDWYDSEFICSRLAGQKPIWPPGSASGYHPITFGFLAGEIARRADKRRRSLGTILQEELCGPHNIDFHIGTPVSEHGRCGDLRKPRTLADLGDINDATKAAFMTKWAAPGGVDMETFRLAEFPASNGHGNAKSLAQIMQLALNGHIDETRYFSDQTLDELRQPRFSGLNLVIPFHLTFAAGIMINAPLPFYGPNDNTVGHSGWGGSCVFADPDTDISCAYVMNKQSNILIGDPRPLRLIDALYECL